MIPDDSAFLGRLPGSRSDALERIATAAADYRAIFTGVTDTDPIQIDAARARMFAALAALDDVEPRFQPDPGDRCTEPGVICLKTVVRNDVDGGDCIAMAHVHLAPGFSIGEIAAATMGHVLAQKAPDGRRVGQWAMP